MAVTVRNSASSARHLRSGPCCCPLRPFSVLDSLRYVGNGAANVGSSVASILGVDGANILHALDLCQQKPKDQWSLSARRISSYKRFRHGGGRSSGAYRGFSPIAHFAGEFRAYLLQRLTHWRNRALPDCKSLELCTGGVIASAWRLPERRLRFPP